MSVDIRTRYLGLDLRSPIVASASPLTGDPETARRLAEAGARLGVAAAEGYRVVVIEDDPVEPDEA